ncbi:ABC transporter ATP-binding protein [Paenibacillus marinisediminis]
MKLILKYLRPYKWLVLLNFLGVFGFAAAELGIPTIVANMIDYGIVQEDTSYIYQMGLWIIFVAILGGAGSILISYCSSKVSTNITRDIRNDIFVKSQDFSHAEYNKFGISSLITRTTNDAFQLQQFVNMLLRMALLTPVMLVISIILTVRTSLELSAVIGLSIPFIIIGVVVIVKLSNPISERQQKGMDKLNRVSRENLTGIRVIRAFRKERYEEQRFEETNAQFASNSKKLFKLMSVTQPIFFLLLNIAVLFIFWISSNLIDMGDLKVGQLVAFLEYTFHAMFSIMLFSFVFVMYPRAQVSANRIHEVLVEPSSIANPVNGIQDTNERGLIEFDQVSFHYPNGEVPVLKDISFTAKTGETIAFIGSTGSGKSTLINLIPRFYDVTTGSIRINGVDIREYDLKALREKIGFIPQKTFLFSGSIGENIKFGKHDADMNELEHSAKVAQAYEFIAKKPHQFDEPISEGGANVSGGQKQRLSIARAVVRKPEIYIFDDSFSALDFKTDALLREQLKEETQDAITLIVAQRVSSILEATRIIVLNEGEIVGIGTHQELLKSCSIYYEIASSQLTKEELSI